MKNVIDSSVWIELVAKGGLPEEVLTQIEDPAELVVPTVVVLEVGKWLRRHAEVLQMARVLGWMKKGLVVDLSMQLAIAAARAGVEHRLPLADSIIYATARAHEAALWTMDRHFEGLEGVRMVVAE